MQSFNLPTQQFLESSKNRKKNTVATKSLSRYGQRLKLLSLQKIIPNCRLDIN